MQYILYLVGLLTTTLSVLLGNPALALSEQPIIGVFMLAAPLFSALLGTVATRLRTQMKYSICMMSSFEIIAEIYKFRVGAMEYDQTELAKALMPKTDDKKKKKNDEEIVAPISSKEKDRLARKTFVERVQLIYTKCMESELSKGASPEMHPRTVSENTVVLAVPPRSPRVHNLCTRLTVVVPCCAFLCVVVLLDEQAPRSATRRVAWTRSGC